MHIKTPQEKYQKDSMFKALVDLMEAHIHQADYTPSEMREAAMLASIHYEYRRERPVGAIQSLEVEKALETLGRFTDSRFAG